MHVKPMTAESFRSWLAAMKAAGIARSDAECARLLDRTPRHILTYKQQGTDRTTALACRALLKGLAPYA